MDRVVEYKALLRQIISEYAAIKPSYGDIEVETIFDDEKGHYEMLYAGWHNRRRIHGPVIHADVRDGKIWIQHDGTEEGIANELVDAGVPREHIVLAFHYPPERKYTDFAVS